MPFLKEILHFLFQQSFITQNFSNIFSLTKQRYESKFTIVGNLFPMYELKFTIVGIYFQDKLPKVATKALKHKEYENGLAS